MTAYTVLRPNIKFIKARSEATFNDQRELKGKVQLDAIQKLKITL